MTDLLNVTRSFMSLHLVDLLLQTKLFIQRGSCYFQRPSSVSVQCGTKSHPSFPCACLRLGPELRGQKPQIPRVAPQIQILTSDHVTPTFCCRDQEHQQPVATKHCDSTTPANPTHSLPNLSRRTRRQPPRCRASETTRQTWRPRTRSSCGKKLSPITQSSPTPAKTSPDRASAPRTPLKTNRP